MGTLECFVEMGGGEKVVENRIYTQQLYHVGAAVVVVRKVNVPT